MSKNEHYGMLNDRFEGRSLRLRKLGFRYEKVEGYDLAVFTMRRFGKVHAVSASLVIAADEIVWGDYLADAERFAR